MYEHSENTGNRIKILYIDDDETGCILVREILCNSDIEVITAREGNEAVRLFKSDTSISLVISDIKLPKMTGFEVLKNIREIDANIPVIAHSAYLHTGIIEECMRSGFNEFIPKPFDVNQFLIIVEKYLNRR